MLLVGNVCVNRVRADCHDFKNINSVQDMAFQSPGGFEAVQYPYFYQRAREEDIVLARRAIKGEQHEPASTALWFYNPFQKKLSPSILGTMELRTLRCTLLLHSA
jgi:N-acetylmuramoyl-L-alanine amidase